MNAPARAPFSPHTAGKRPYHCHAHRAMATVFEIYITGKPAEYAGQAAFAAFQELDRLELELSRFIENSDISRINNLAPGQRIRIGPDAFDCLKACEQLSARTGGAFDITVGALVDCWRERDESAPAPTPEEIEQARQRTGLHRLALDEEEHTVQLLHDQPVAVDLGGFGKGYAVDKISELLQEWGIETALIHGGTSSIFAFGNLPGEIGWPVTLRHPFESQCVFAKVFLQNQAVSGSGLQKGQHIIDPRTGQPLAGRRVAWVSAPDAASSDALSTACMMMPPQEVEAFCADHPDVRALLFFGEGEGGTKANPVLRFGEWESGG